jgi:ribosomal protein S18 acetylase RimI-like enzyme
MTIIRDAVASDARALGALHVRTWREAYWGLLPDRTVLRETVESRSRFWRAHLEILRGSESFLDEDVALAVEPAKKDGESEAVGFVWTGAARLREAEWDGEVYMIYVLNAAQRRGVGRALLARAAQSLVRRGFFRFGLWVLETNGQAQAFYEALGGRPIGVRRSQAPGELGFVIGYVWEDASALLDAAPARD